MSINTFAAIVSDNDGSAFITKSEFDALKSSFQSQIDTYNNSIDSKIDGAIASYLAGIKISNTSEVNNDYYTNGNGNIVWRPSSFIQKGSISKNQVAWTYNLVGGYTQSGADTIATADIWTGDKTKVTNTTGSVNNTKIENLGSATYVLKYNSQFRHMGIQIIANTYPGVHPYIMELNGTVEQEVVSGTSFYKPLRRIRNLFYVIATRYSTYNSTNTWGSYDKGRPWKDSYTIADHQTAYIDVRSTYTTTRYAQLGGTYVNTIEWNEENLSNAYFFGTIPTGTTTCDFTLDSRFLVSSDIKLSDGQLVGSMNPHGTAALNLDGSGTGKDKFWGYNITNYKVPLPFTQQVNMDHITPGPEAETNHTTLWGGAVLVSNEIKQDNLVEFSLKGTVDTTATTQKIKKLRCYFRMKDQFENSATTTSKNISNLKLSNTPVSTDYIELTPGEAYKKVAFTTTEKGKLYMKVVPYDASGSIVTDKDHWSSITFENSTVLLTSQN